MQNKKWFKSKIFYANALLSLVVILFAINTLSASGHAFIQRAIAAVGNVVGVANQGTVNFMTKFVGASGANQVGDSIIYDNGTRIGIGTITPQTTLDVRSTSVYGLGVGGAGGTNIVGIGNRNTAASINGYTAGFAGVANLALQPDGGNVGIGATTIGAGTKLQVVGTGLFTSGSSDPGDGSPAGVRVGYNTASGYGFIQSMQTAVAYKNLALQLGGGNVGIGTATPFHKLSIVQNLSSLPMEGEYGFSLSSDSTVQLVFGTNSAGGYSVIQSFDPGTSWGTKPLSLMPNGGNLGIGTVAPLAKLHVSNAGAAGVELDATGGISGGGYVQSYNRATSAYQGFDFYASQFVFNVGNVGVGVGPVHKLQAAGNIVNSAPTQGYLGLTGDLPQIPGVPYPPNTYPTLKTASTAPYIYFSAADYYSGWVGPAQVGFYTDQFVVRNRYTTIGVQPTGAPIYADQLIDVDNQTYTVNPNGASYLRAIVLVPQGAPGGPSLTNGMMWMEP